MHWGALVTVSYTHLPIKVAVMGCVVNGPGEAREADFGIAGGKGQGIVFRKGEVLKTVPESELVDTLFREIDQYLETIDKLSLIHI